MQIFKLIDVYRIIEPAERECTFYNDHYKTDTLLDIIYISRMNVDCILHVEHLPVALSDHIAISLDLKLSSRKLGCMGFYWKCCVSTLRDPFFIDDINETYKLFLIDCAGSLSGPKWEEFKGKVNNLNNIHSQRLAASRKSKLEDIESKWRNAADKTTAIKCKDEIKRLVLYITSRACASGSKPKNLKTEIYPRNICSGENGTEPKVRTLTGLKTTVFFSLSPEIFCNPFIITIALYIRRNA
jgi:hypothetical protein